VIAEYQDVVPPHPRASLATSPHRREVNLWHGGAPSSTYPQRGEVDFERSEKSGEGDPPGRVRGILRRICGHLGRDTRGPDAGEVGARS
jgi:hypothetical protein